MSQPAARVGDMHTCPMVDPGPKPHVGGPVLPPGCPTVLIGGMPAARIGDQATCVGPPDAIAKGSASVLIGGQPAARIGDTTAHGGVIVVGCPTVLIGDQGSGAAAGGGAAADAAGGAVAAAGATAPTFASADDAARAALDDANPRSISQNTEYGGLIYRDETGQYGFTPPAAGDGTSFNPHDVEVPEGTTVVGDYHTHGDYSAADAQGNPVRTSDPSQDAFNSDNFSRSDLKGIRNDARGNPDYRGYLGTPSGQYRVYNPQTNTVSDLN